MDGSRTRVHSVIDYCFPERVYTRLPEAPHLSTLAVA